MPGPCQPGAGLLELVVALAEAAWNDIPGAPGCSPPLCLGRKRLPSRPVPVPASVFLLLKNEASAAIRNGAVELLVGTPCEMLWFDDMVQQHFQKTDRPVNYPLRTELH